MTEAQRRETRSSEREREHTRGTRCSEQGLSGKAERRKIITS
jgi:hypothetical protein